MYETVVKGLLPTARSDGNYHDRITLETPLHHDRRCELTGCKRAQNMNYASLTLASARLDTLNRVHRAGSLYLDTLDQRRGGR